MFKNVFGSGFLVRTAHVILTWVITLILFLHDTGESEPNRLCSVLVMYGWRGGAGSDDDERERR